MYQEKRLYQNNIVYYQQHKRPYKIVIRPAPPRHPLAPPRKGQSPSPDTKPREGPAPSVPPTPTPHNPIDDLTDKDGLDQAYSTDADLSAIKARCTYPEPR